MKALANGSSDSTQIIAAENALGDYINSLKTSDPNNPELGALTRPITIWCILVPGEIRTSSGGAGIHRRSQYPPKHTDPRGI